MGRMGAADPAGLLTHAPSGGRLKFVTRPFSQKPLPPCGGGGPARGRRGVQLDKQRLQHRIQINQDLERLEPQFGHALIKTT